MSLITIKSYKFINLNTIKIINNNMKLFYHSKMIHAKEKICNDHSTNNNNDDGIVVDVSIGNDYSLKSSYNANMNKQANGTPKELLYSSLAR